MQGSGPSLDVLPRAECLRLLGTVPVGRVIFTENALPAIRLVNFVLDGDTIVFRAGPGSTLAAALRHSVVAFEADNVDLYAHTGWTVTVIGISSEITNGADHDRVCALPLRSWAPGPLDHLVRVTAELVSGRRLEHVVGTRGG